ncbi:MAG: hypothetical protein R3Y11_08525 [Pseudomonadota bacterium]
MDLNTLRELTRVYMEKNGITCKAMGEKINLSIVHMDRFLTGIEGLNAVRTLQLIDIIGYEILPQYKGAK